MEGNGPDMGSKVSGTLDSVYIYISNASISPVVGHGCVHSIAVVKKSEIFCSLEHGTCTGNMIFVSC